MLKVEHKCDQCSTVTEWWTIAKGFDLLCDDCLNKRMAKEYYEKVEGNA